uniref:protein IWS1 homolog n=1 Tax=Scatophagus argus TaxID=75038 RepID=UPI001ED8221A|nr:protein IWS1 homolog [Scatophagus argus]
MDGEEDDFMSGNHSDDGGGTPVQDEHGGSDGEEMRSDRHESEDERSNDEDATNGVETSGAASGSDNEDHRGADSDSEPDASGTRHNDDKSDSEAEAPRPADSDDDSPVKRRMSGSDNEEESSPVKHAASDNEEEGGSSPAKRRGSSSELEEGEERPKVATHSDSENEDAKPAASPSRRSNAGSDSDTETPARRKTAQVDSEEEEEKQQEEAEGGAEGGKWKAVMQSDSEEEGEERRRKAAAGSDGEQHQEEEREQRDDSDDEEEKPVKRKKAILSDSEDDEEEKADKPAVKRSRAVSDDENSDSDGGSTGPDKSLAAKLRELGSDSGSEEDERSKATAGKKDEKALFGSDSDSGDDEEEKMIADIFGESGDEEEEEFTGFNQEDLEGDKKQSKDERQQHAEEDSDSDDGVHRGGQDTSFMSDFDIMLARRKAMNSKRRRHRDGGTFISDADDVVSAMITKMNEAAEEDRTLNSHKKPALKKLTLLPQVVMHLKKQDLKETFIDSGVMTAIKEWISPLPDKSLPALRIREELLRILQELPTVSQETLKHSGIGRAVMFLYKHPKESRSNKDLALKLINEWSRPIFGLTSNYKGMTREERQQRDLDQQMPQRRRLSSGGQTPRRDLEKQLTGEEKALRPGDPGFCARARVPMPSNKDYVVRPKWNVEMESNRGPMKKGLSRVDKQMRRFADIRRLTKPGHAVKISVEGNRMPL